MIKLKVLRGGDSPGLCGWVQCHHRGPYMREAGGVWASDVTVGGKEPQSDDRRHPPEPGKGKETHSPQELPEANSLP